MAKHVIDARQVPVITTIGAPDWTTGQQVVRVIPCRPAISGRAVAIVASGSLIGGGALLYLGYIAGQVAIP